jgi:hypothetical protein
MVGERGFEPPTPWSRTRCSTRLSHSPTAVGPLILLQLRCLEAADSVEEGCLLCGSGMCVCLVESESSPRAAFDATMNNNNNNNEEAAGEWPCSMNGGTRFLHHAVFPAEPHV